MGSMKDTINQGLETVSNAVGDGLNNLGDQIKDTIVDQTGLKSTTTVSSRLMCFEFNKTILKTKKRSFIPINI